MVPPSWAIPLGIAFLVLCAIGYWTRPPLTPRGRFFYALSGVAGVVTGATWLLWNAALCGFERPRPPWVPEKPASAIVGDMFSFGKDGYALSSLLACTFCGVGLWVGQRAFLWPSYRDPEDRSCVSSDPSALRPFDAGAPSETQQ